MFFISRSVLLRMRNFSGKRCRGNQNTHFVFNIYFFFENRAVYEIMCKNMVQPGRPRMTIWRMRIACWIHKATNTHSEYLQLTASPLQRWLHKRTSVLSYSSLPVFFIFRPDCAAVISSKIRLYFLFFM